MSYSEPGPEKVLEGPLTFLGSGECPVGGVHAEVGSSLGRDAVEGVLSCEKSR